MIMRFIRRRCASFSTRFLMFLSAANAGDSDPSNGHGGLLPRGKAPRRSLADSAAWLLILDWQPSRNQGRRALAITVGLWSLIWLWKWANRLTVGYEIYHIWDLVLVLREPSAGGDLSSGWSSSQKGNGSSEDSQGSPGV